MTENHRPGRYEHHREGPPEPQRVTEAVVMRFEKVFEVDPGLMRDFQQQRMPAWDTMRIVQSRLGHLDDVHGEFADSIVLAGEGPDEESTDE